jgi:uncharacterized glyoxalase superfamily protein PhnB
MTDPLDALREPVIALAPRPAFAAELRRRIVAELDPTPIAPEGATMSETTTTHTVTPYIAVHDAARAIDWYREVFDAEVVDGPHVMDDGRIGSVDLRIGDSVFGMSDPYPEETWPSPQDLGGTATGFRVQVADAEATLERAVAAGARNHRPVAEQYGRVQATIFDPFGHRWTLEQA